ncbi:MAG TPA: GNAT family N-acetyltransferase [Actinomycetota bacterium]|nr:GNAT family N-acetyltransferase [Actinomycetota bacterium]
MDNEGGPRPASEDAGFRLETERLILRPFALDDLDELAPILGDAETMQYYPAPFTRERSRQWIVWNLANYRDHGHGLWVLESRETGELLGDCGLIPQTIDGRKEVEVGWHVKKTHWSRGLATEAGAACRDHAFGELGLTRLISLIRPENVPSRRVAEKLGMTIEKEISHGPGSGMPHFVYVLEKT